MDVEIEKKMSSKSRKDIILNLCYLSKRVYANYIPLSISSQVSYFTSLSLTEHSIFIYGTSMAVSDLLGRVFLVIFTDRLPLTETNLLIFVNLLFVAVTLVFVCWPTDFALLTCSLCKCSLVYQTFQLITRVRGQRRGKNKQKGETMKEN